MTPLEKKLVDVFMEGQAKPEGRMFSENVLAGLKAVLRYTHEARLVDAAMAEILQARDVSDASRLVCPKCGHIVGLIQ